MGFYATKNLCLAISKNRACLMYTSVCVHKEKGECAQ